MPVSVVVGGQYGSEGKGKVALELVRGDPSTTIVVRPGGTNSGHTAFARDGRRLVLRQLPAAAIDRNVRVLLPAGAYIDVDLLERELAQVQLAPEQLVIDPRAQIIRSDHAVWESQARLVDNIGSTGSGTGAAVLSRIARFAPGLPGGTEAADEPRLASFLSDTVPILSDALNRGERVLVEGTQGFGLSVIHGDSWPKCTSRDTTASAFIAEAGISPRHIDQIVLVIRCHPIRVAGDSGPLLEETTWEAIARSSGRPDNIQEFTSVTKKLRRVGHFDGQLVRRAIMANAPTHIVLNHLDYVDAGVTTSSITSKARSFVDEVERSIGSPVDWLGVNDRTIVANEAAVAA